jgi:hypothetical protein
MTLRPNQEKRIVCTSYPQEEEIMKAAKKLVLKKEALSELTSDELAHVAAGAQTIWDCIVTRVFQECPTRGMPVCDKLSVMVNPCPTDACP